MAFAALFAIIGVVLLRLSAREERPASVSSGGVQRQPSPGFLSLERPDLGYTVDVPAGWTPAEDNSPSTTSYAAFRPVTGSMRVTVGRDDATLDEHVDHLIGLLRQQGGRDLVKVPVQISGLPAIRLDYRFPISPIPGAPPVSIHSSYLVKRDSTVLSLQLATTDPTAQKLPFAHIAASLHLL